MDQINALRTFRHVAETLSFTRAAERLGTSRAAATRTIRELEDAIGIRLFNRTTRSVTLTAEGERVLREAEQALAATDAIFSRRRHDAPLSGTLRVASSLAISEFMLAKRLEEFQDLHPSLRIELIASAALVPLVESRIDIGFEVGLVPRPGAAVRTIGKCRSLLCASPGYLGRHPAPEDPAGLAEHELIALGERDRWTLARAGETKRIDVDSRLALTSAQLALAAALRGRGIACLPDLAVAGPLARGELMQVLPGWTLPVLEVWAVFPTERLISPAAAALCEFVEAGIAEKTGAA